MPLSRFTQTFPLDLAAAVSESEAAPEGAGLEARFAGAGELLAAGALAGALAEVLMEDLLEAGVGAVEEVFAAGAAIPESAEALLFRLRLGVAPSAVVVAVAD